MTSSRTRSRVVRRDRRKAKQSGFLRSPKKWGGVGHGTRRPETVDHSREVVRRPETDGSRVVEPTTTPLGDLLGTDLQMLLEESGS